MKKRLLIITCSFFVIPAFAQVGKDALFTNTEPLDIAFSFSVKTIKNSSLDSVYFKETMYYRNARGVTDSLEIGLKRRGNFRLSQCYFPPLWIKIAHKNSKHTLFDGNKKLKLVLPCRSDHVGTDLILREYLCYKMYEAITSYSFRSRLVNIELKERKGKKYKVYQLKGIMIEDVDKTARRNDSKTTPAARVPVHLLNDTCALRFDLFQLLIANTDWSKRSQHNCKLIYQKSKYIPIPYDFDMSGVVDAPYAIVSPVGEEQLPIQSVRERYYNGYCTSDETTQFVRKEFLANQQKLLAVPDELKGILSDKQMTSLKSYLEDFFKILKDDVLFRDEVLKRCRPRT